MFYLVITIPSTIQIELTKYWNWMVIIIIRLWMIYLENLIFWSLLPILYSILFMYIYRADVMKLCVIVKRWPIGSFRAPVPYGSSYVANPKEAYIIMVIILTVNRVIMSKGKRSRNHCSLVWSSPCLYNYV